MLISKKHLMAAVAACFVLAVCRAGAAQPENAESEAGTASRPGLSGAAVALHPPEIRIADTAERSALEPVGLAHRMRPAHKPSSLQVAERSSRESKAATELNTVRDEAPQVGAEAGPGVQQPRVGRADKVALLQVPDKSNAPERREATGTVRMAFSMIFKLGVVLAMAYVTILALKWLYARRDVPVSGRRHMRILDTVRLSSTSSLHVVEVNGRSLLVGASTGAVSLLRELDEQEEAEPGRAQDGRFAEYLAQYSGPSQGRPAGRVASLLRDCAAYLRDRHLPTGHAGLGGKGDGSEV